MVCKDCVKFKPEKSMEASKEISPSLKGKCNVNNKACMSGDNCGCGGFTKK